MQAFPLRQSAITSITAPSVEEVFREDLAVRLICPSCQDPTPNLAEEYSSGDLVCRSCGLVLSDRIVDERSEWRTFAGDEKGDDPSRVGGPSPLAGLGGSADQFSTIISDRDGNSGLAKELQKAALRTQRASGEKNLVGSYKEISAVCEKINLPTMVSDIAKQLYKRQDDEKLLKGKSNDAIIAACIFIACRQAGVSRTFKEIVELSRVPKKVLGQCFKILKSVFDTNDVGTGGITADGTVVTDTTHRVNLGGNGPEDTIVRFCNHLGMSAYIQSRGREVVRKVMNLGVLDGRSPVTVAGSCIYLTAHLFGEPRSARDIGEVAGVTDGTIRMAYRLIHPHLDEVIDQAWIDSGRADRSLLPSV
ncbi:uncharacterized protein L969DRAFT_96771 [Mixia osmundae IAM 14324]|uniref:Transcription initiation factor IIB n=1 Tax=Mixia osmundae (strain CBS 9802 / IAM 14324 / JCM 22182 / KY 12970) TaxID=764103 RepID=G7DSZ2_MIXOS|nr:uncharacterized protein L969DRAFT_96771 [Mixia osmundae IAM 14324]KEI37213.1 hypothetical protein L969DRAFT_96771 [Mixia osmundae IAM 14324]GAA93702.1 hypothetical protein E5Q_00347 [Mixia osmundae IAM 14324]